MTRLTFKSFLLEKTVTDHPDRKKPLGFTEDSHEEAYAYLMENCSDAFTSYLEDRTVIYRGMSSAYDSLEVEYGLGKRAAQNVSDYYRLILDSNPDFADFPKRSKSMIASTSMFYASGYGKTHFVFPFNGSKIGVVPFQDIFDVSFEFLGNSFMQVPNFSKVFDWLFAVNKVAEQDIVSLDDFIQSLDDIGIDEIYYSFAFSPNLSRFKLNDGVSSPKEFSKKYKIYDGKSFVKYLFKVLHPTNLKLEVFKTDQFYQKITKDKDHEVWISDKCAVFTEPLMVSFFPKFVQLYSNK